MSFVRTLPLHTNLNEVSGTFPNIVVIDVLRACTSAIVAFDHGAKAIYPCASRNEAWKLYKELREKGIEPLLCGERKGFKIEGFDLGNSPLEFTREKVQGRTLIMATTNGTKALKGAEAVAAQDERGWIGIAAFLNAGAVAQKLSASPGDCLIVCSGKEGFFSLEDFIGAGLIVHELLGRTGVTAWSLDDASRAALELYRQHESNLLQLLRTCSHGAYLIECGFEADLPVCAQVNISQWVPTYRQGQLLAR